VASFVTLCEVLERLQRVSVVNGARTKGWCRDLCAVPARRSAGSDV